MRRTLCLAVAACALLGIGLVPCGSAQASVKLTKAERQVLTYVNKARRNHGRRPLRVQVNLMRAARAHSRGMASGPYFSHSSTNGVSFAQRLLTYGYKRTGCRSWTVGENIYCAKVGTLSATPRIAVRSWMHSKAHRRVMLRATFRDVGIGIASGSGTRYFTLDLGRRVR